MKWKLTLSCLLAALSVSAPAAMAGRKVIPPVALNRSGQMLLARYSFTLQKLRKRISRILPAMNSDAIKRFMAACRLEAACKPYLDSNESYAQAVRRCQRLALPVLTAADTVLSGDKLDALLIKASVIADATPRGLAAFGQQSRADAGLIHKLLSKPALMRQMQMADGARDGNYGRTMQIYTAIEHASPRAQRGILQRMALAIALFQKPSLAVMSVKPRQFHPVLRFLNYQKAYLNGELAPAFPTFSTWECRFIANDPFDNHEIDWFRQMLMNYEPEYIFSSHYLNIVHTDVGYCHPHWGIVPGSKAAQVVAGGGECGPRAWFGRLAERAFGIPTWGVRQRGHAALSHWTPRGWITRLGAGWRWNWWGRRRGREFYRETQARRYPRTYMKVLRAQWIAAALGEQKPDGMVPGTGGFWYALADSEQRKIVASGKPVRALATNAELAEKWGLTLMQKVESRPIAPSAMRIAVNADGVILIPAVACSRPVTHAIGIRITRSFLGGMQMHYFHVRKRKAAPLCYAVDVPHAGTYNVTAKVVTVKPPQHLLLLVNHAVNPIRIRVPWTDGMWQRTRAIEIYLSRGKNALRFIQAKGFFAVSIKDFSLTPAKPGN